MKSHFSNFENECDFTYESNELDTLVRRIIRIHKLYFTCMRMKHTESNYLRIFLHDDKNIDL